MSSTNSDDSMPLTMPRIIQNYNTETESEPEDLEIVKNINNNKNLQTDDQTLNTITQNSKNDSQSETLYDDETDSEDDIDPDPTIIYVVTIDDTPMFYCESPYIAKDRMNQYASRLINGMISRNTYNISDLYLRQNIVSKDEVHIVSQYKFFVLSYDKIVHRLKIHPIPNR